MERRTLIGLAGTALTTMTAGCGSDSDDSNDGRENRDGDDTGNGGDTTDTPGSNGGDPPEAGELSAVSENPGWLENTESFSGSGQTVTDAFQAARFTTFTYEYSGDGNFIAQLIDDDSGEDEDLLVNQIGATSGTVGTGLADGSYILDVDAEGDWSIEAGEPFAPDDEWGVPPASISGEGSDVYGEVEIDGRVTVSGSHDGESNFIVAAWEEANTTGRPDELIFNEMGSHEGETSVQLSGAYYIAVEADGSYEISIE